MGSNACGIQGFDEADKLGEFISRDIKPRLEEQVIL